MPESGYSWSSVLYPEIFVYAEAEEEMYGHHCHPPILNLYYLYSPVQGVEMGHLLLLFLCDRDKEGTEHVLRLWAG